jgi:N-acetylglucosamine malate deacetylase 1
MSESNDLKLDLLIFAAHADDAEIGMGGTIAKHVMAGDRVGIIDLTQAEMSSNGDVKTRLKEAAHAAEVLGLAVRDNLGLPDRGLAVVPAMIDRMITAIRKYRPRLVFAPYAIDRHPDHVACSKMAEEAVFSAKLRKYLPQLPAWEAQQLIFYFINDAHTPQLLVDITDTQHTKMEALRAYRSQFMPEGADAVETPLTAAYLEAVIARDRLLGQPKRYAYAEGFIPKGPIVLNRL